jgi:hypothetical protein
MAPRRRVYGFYISDHGSEHGFTASDLDALISRAMIVVTPDRS